MSAGEPESIPVTHGADREASGPGEPPLYANHVDAKMSPDGVHVWQFGFRVTEEEAARPVCPPIVMPDSLFRQLERMFVGVHLTRTQQQ